ncbi:hypothetical protein DWZ21_29445 [Hungatella hathewayi]|nr:hypothetical protein DWZ21_29445 [Hungatella hathewayi]
MAFKIIASLVFIAAFFTRIIKPEWNIDSTSIILLVLACVPWFMQYIKSLEINGVGKIELVDAKQKKEIEQKAKDAGIVASKSKDTQQYAFYNLRYDDPKLSLAGLRIEIESVLRKIAEKNGLDVSRSGLGRITDILSQHQLISGNERAIIFDITGILNKAVHSQLDEFQSESIDWVFDLGLDILKSLNEKL